MAGMFKYPELGTTIIQVVRTVRLGTGWRSVWYLPGGQSVHAIEDNPIPAGQYFLRPDDTGRYKNWVIESELGTRTVLLENGSHWTDVEVHAGNTLADSAACFCPGILTSPDGVHQSRLAIIDMRLALDRDDPTPPVWFINITEPKS